MHKIAGAHLQLVNYYHAKFEYKIMKTIFKITQTRHQKVLRTEGQTDGVDPLLDPRFAKVTQVTK